jgi:hypothetical protein
MPIIALAILGAAGLLAGAGYVATRSGEIVEQPAVKALSLAALIYAVHLLLKDAGR